MLLNRRKNPIMLGAPGVPVPGVGLQRVNHSTSNVGLVDHSRVHLLLLGRIGGITRNFTTLDRAFGMYYSIPIYQMAVGDTVEFKYLAPTATTPDTFEFIGGDVIGGSDARFNMLVGGTFADAGFDSTFLLDGVPTATSSTYPIDGKVHSAMLTSNSTLSIAALCARQNATAFYSGIMYDVVIKNSGGDIQRDYRIDETWIGPSTVLNDSSVNAQHGTAVNIDVDDSESYTADGIDWINNNEIWTDPPDFIGTQWVDDGGGQYTLTGTGGFDGLQMNTGITVGFDYINGFNVVSLVGEMKIISGSAEALILSAGIQTNIVSALGTHMAYGRRSGTPTCVIKDISLKRILRGTP